jgi:hypothetical protein
MRLPSVTRALLLPARIFFVLLVAFVVWQVWVFSRPRPRVYSESERRAVLAAVETAFAPVVERIGERPTRFGVARFVGDSGDQVTQITREFIASRKNWTALDESPIQRFLADVARSVLNATGLDEVVNAGRRVGIDVVVAGETLKVEQTDVGATAALKLHVFDARAGETLVSGTFERDWRPGPAARAAMRMRGMSGWTRLVLWLAFVGLLPWVSAAATHKAVGKKSNLASFLLVFGHTVLGLALAMAFWSFDLDCLFGAVKLLAALSICGGYSYWACERIAARG